MLVPFRRCPRLAWVLVLLGVVAVPNLFCVAGAFLFGFSGLTAVMISNLGTLALYRRAVGSLRELVPSCLGPSRANVWRSRV